MVKRINSWITSRIAMCSDCSWGEEGIEDDVNRHAHAHAKKHGHRVCVESAKVTYYDYRRQEAHDAETD